MRASDAFPKFLCGERNGEAHSFRRVFGNPRAHFVFSCGRFGGLHCRREFHALSDAGDFPGIAHAHCDQRRQRFGGGIPAGGAFFERSGRRDYHVRGLSARGAHLCFEYGRQHEQRD